MTPHTPPDPTPHHHTTGTGTGADNGAGADGAGASGELTDFTIDLTPHETLRRAHMMQALGDHWNPTETLHTEETAHTLLYTQLDPHQQHLYNTLTTAGILPTQEHPHAAP
ncbi:DUF6400 family protein [Streptomyces erythrochromogenes]|uniref:DUF6400 family protein n=1 Tax=Streptomyces erythrochromogenes TaxID=285574 RepID=UPI0036954D4A